MFLIGEERSNWAALPFLHNHLTESSLVSQFICSILLPTVCVFLKPFLWSLPFNTPQLILNFCLLSLSSSFITSLFILVCLFSSFVCVISKYRLIGELHVGSYWPLQVILIVQSLIFLSFTIKENGCPFYCLWPWGYIYISVNLLMFVFLKPQLHVYHDKGFFFFFSITDSRMTQFLSFSLGRQGLHFISYACWKISSI